MKLLKIALGLSLLPLSAFAAKKECRFVVDTGSVKVAWTAFKTSEKTPVQGTLKDLTFKTPVKGGKSLKAVLAQTKAFGQIDSEKKSDSGNPARDLTLFQKFFSLIASQGKVSGAFTHIKGDEKAGQMDLRLDLNGKARAVTMKYTMNSTGDFEASGEFDMNDYGLEAALASIHKACEELHKGKDGVSKTWPNVGVKLTAKINKDCK